MRRGGGQVCGYLVVFFGAVFGALLASDIQFSTWYELFSNPRLVIGALAAGTSAVAGFFLRDPRQTFREWGQDDGGE